MRSILATVLVTIFSFDFINVSATDFTDGDFTYTILTDNTCAVKSTTLTEGTLTIPSTATDGSTTYTVTEIASSAFANKKGFTGINLPESLTAVRGSAFGGCTSVKSDIEFKSKVDVVEMYGFANNYGINGNYYTNRTLYFRKGVDVLDTQSFNGALFFEVILNDVKEIGVYAFQGASYNAPLRYLSFSGEDIKISNAAFYGCKWITEIEIRSSKIPTYELEINMQ